MTRFRLAAATLAVAVAATACSDSTPSTPDTADPVPQESESESAEGVDVDVAVDDVCADLAVMLDPNGSISEQPERRDAALRLEETFELTADATTFGEWAAAWSIVLDADEVTPEVVGAYADAINPLVSLPISGDMAAFEEQCGLDDTQMEMLTVAVDGNPVDELDNATEALDYLLGVLSDGGDPAAYVAGGPDAPSTIDAETFCATVIEERFETPSFGLGGGVKPFAWHIDCLANPEFAQYAFSVVRGRVPNDDLEAPVAEVIYAEGDGFVDGGAAIQEFMGAPIIGGLSLYDEDTSTTLVTWYASIEGRDVEVEGEGEPSDPPQPDFVVLRLAGKA